METTSPATSGAFLLYAPPRCFDVDILSVTLNKVDAAFEATMSFASTLYQVHASILQLPRCTSAALAASNARAATAAAKKAIFGILDLMRQHLSYARSGCTIPPCRPRSTSSGPWIGPP